MVAVNLFMFMFSDSIVAVADVFDALSNKRPYKPAFPIADKDGRCHANTFATSREYATVCVPYRNRIG